jgi:putative hydrolase of the HAD superfamily
MATIKNVLFDLGGVIIDLDKDAAVRQFKKIGLTDVEKYLDPYAQRGFFRQFESGEINTNEFYDQIRELVCKCVDEEEIDRGWLSFLKPVDLERLQFILDLRGRYRTFMLSNTNPIVMQWANSCEFTPSRRPLKSYFDDVYLSYELRCLKPDPEIFRRVLDLSQINPEETLYIDDSPENIKTGAELGFRTLLYGSNNTFADIRRELEPASDKA